MYPFFSIMPSMLEILWGILFVTIASVVPVLFPSFFFLFSYPSIQFSLLIIFPLSILYLFCSFHFTVCVFIDFLEELISFLLKYLYHIHKVFSKSLIHILAILKYLGISMLGLLGSYGDTLSWLLLILFLYWLLGI